MSANYVIYIYYLRFCHAGRSCSISFSDDQAYCFFHLTPRKVSAMASEVPSAAASERPSINRRFSACDSCAIRRVRCDGGKPCEQCRTRSMRCTSFSSRKKPGPKGPRPSTTLKILELQRKGDLDVVSLKESEKSEESPESSQSPPLERVCTSQGGGIGDFWASQVDCLDTFELLPLQSYIICLDIFHENLYPIWPVIAIQELKERLAICRADVGAYTLAAAICAATISQLNHASNIEVLENASSLQFALVAQCAREVSHIPTSQSTDQILLNLFMHIYFINIGKFQSAADYVQKAAAALQYHQLLQESTNPTTIESDVDIQRLEIFSLVCIMERSAKYTKKSPFNGNG